MNEYQYFLLMLDFEHAKWS